MKALKVAAIGLCAVAALVWLLFFGIPIGFMIGTLQSRIEARTGYQLKIAGSARLTVLPAPSVVINDVSLLDPASGASQTGLTLESVRVEGSLSSLFGDRPQIGEIILVRPTFRVLARRERIAPPAKPSGKSDGERTSVAALTVDHCGIHDGTVVFVNRAGSVESKLEHIDLVGSLAADDALDVVAAARSGTQDLRLRVKGKAPEGGFDGRPIPVEFTFDAPGLLQAPLVGTAEVRPAGTVLRINSVSGAIGPNTFSGWASVDLASKPLVKVDLDFQKLDIGAVHAEGAGTLDSGSPPANIDQPWSSTPISLDGLNFFDAEVQISAAALNVETFHFAPISIGVTIDNGVAHASLPQTGLYGGQAIGDLVIDASKPEQSYSLRADFTGVRALPMLTDVANFTALDGRMQTKIDLRARGASEKAIMSSLQGTLDLLIQDGEIRSVNVAQMIRNVTANILSGWQGGTTEKTDFGQLSALFRINNGQATTDNVQLAGPLVRVPGAGTTDVGAKTLQFKLDPKLVMSLQGQGGAANPVGLGVPVVVEGTWGQPKIYPEIAGMLDNPDAAFAKLRELGAGLFGPSAGGQAGGQTGGQAGAQPGAGNLMQSIGEMFKNLGNNRNGSPPPASPPAPPGR